MPKTEPADDALLAELETHFDDCPPRDGETSSTRPLLGRAAARIRALLAEVEGLREELVDALVEVPS